MRANSLALRLFLSATAWTVVILLVTAIAVSSNAGLSAETTNLGAHRFTAIVFAFTSCFANNGQAFASLNANTLFYNVTTAVAMLAGARANVPAACRLLYESLAGRVLGYLRLHGADDAEDLTSEVFLRVFTHLAEFDGDADGLRVNRPTHHITIRENTVVAGAAGVTIGSETSGGVHDILVEGLKVLAGAPAGILFKSASTRGGTIENVTVRNVEMSGVAIPVSVSLNWNPSYSYAKIPDGIEGYPDYWKVLTAPVPPEKGMPHFRDVSISEIKATGAQRAFQVSTYPDAPLLRFRFQNIAIEAKTAGSIAGAQDWTFDGVTLKTGDGSRVDLKDSRGVQGLPR